MNENMNRFFFEMVSIAFKLKQVRAASESSSSCGGFERNKMVTAWVLGSLGSWDSESNSENQNPSIHQGGGDGWLLVWLCSSGPFLTMNFEFDHGPGPGPELDKIW